MMNRIVSLNIVFLMLTLCIPAGFADNYYECPYSGPTDDVELLYSADNYSLDIELVFPAGAEDGALIGITTLNGTSLIDGLNRIDLDFLDVETIVINEVQLDGSSVFYNFTNHEIQIAVSPPLDENDTFQVMVDYRLEGLKHFQFRPPGDERFAFNSMVVASRWFPCLHDPRDKATYDFSITVPDGKIAASNGILQSKINNDDRTVTFNWLESDPMSTYLATINVADYTSFESDYHGMQIIYYVVPEKLADAQFDFAHDHDILDFFISAFGPYPFDKLGVAEVPIGGAMENQDMISFGSALITGDRQYEDIFAHEISHMWWGDSVTLTGCFDVWLNEGFASYCEALWEENFYGQEAYDDVMEAHKQTYFDEDESHRYSIYDPDFVWSPTTYKKAAWVLHMLRWVVGEDAFWSILPEYYDRYKFAHATTADFQAVCEEYYGEDLDWFFQEWIYDQGFPEFELAYQITDGTQATLQVHVKQVQQNAPAVFKMPVKIAWTDDQKTEFSQVVWLDDSDEVFSFNIDTTPTEVEFDPEQKILNKKQWKQWSLQTGVTISMPAHMFYEGDLCSCDVSVTNVESVSLDEYPLFVILDVFTEYYFAPSFSEYDNYLDEYPTFPIGFTDVSVLPEFNWPGGVGSASGIMWYAALTDPAITDLFGNMDTWEFGWAE